MIFMIGKEVRRHKKIKVCDW